METDLHVIEIGRGEPIVFVHGAFDSREKTFPEQRELADQYRIVLVDRRGYGDSPPAVNSTSTRRSTASLPYLTAGPIWSASPTVAFSACWPRQLVLTLCGR
jgi:pimeloyl-ACP methyl ester carboxylesterase